MKEGINKSEFQPLSKYKSIHDRLKNYGIKALEDILYLFNHIIEQNNDEILLPIEVEKVSSTELNIKYLSLPIFIRIQINLDKETGYIEWGVKNKENEAIIYKVMYIYKYDKNGRITLNQDYTYVDHAHVIIPKALIAIIDTIKKENILL